MTTPVTAPPVPPVYRTAKPKRFGWVAASLFALGGLGLGSLIGSSDTTAESTATVATSSSSSEEPTTEPAGTGDFTTTKNDWKPSLKIIDKECFGSAGCNVEARVKMGYYGDSSQIPEDATIEITYKIKGGEDGPVVGTTTVTNQTDYDLNTESVSTRSRSSKLSVDVTDVEVY